MTMTKKGYRQTKEHKQRVQDTRLGRVVSDETRQKQSESAKNRPSIAEETRRKQSEASTGRAQSAETRLKHSEAMMGHLVSKETRQKQSDAKTVHWQDPKYREKQTQLHKIQWQDPEYVQKQMTANHVQPNQMERSAARWLEPLGFLYVGDGQLIIAGKCPDFWDGGVKLIELYGDYWHAGQDPQDRIDLFKAAGYDCLVIWERELKDDLLTTYQTAKMFAESGRT